MVRSTAFGAVSQITTGLRVGACNKLKVRMNSFPFGLVKVLRRWSTAETVAEWHHRTHCHVYGTASMACATCDIMCQFRFPLFWGWPPHASNLQSIFIFYDLRKNTENDEAIQFRLAEPDGFISKAVITITNLHTSPDASAHFAALALDPLFVKD